ncbi:MAG: ABC transporter permease [Bacteroidales bacterium]
MFQDDLLFENLTVFENCHFNAKLRFPGKERNHRAIVDRVLHDIGMYEKRNVKVGDPLHKVLSGGERKRVNIGLELIADSNVILLDEPTSGLSSKDSERILKLLQSLSFQGKIIYVVIHQPSIKLYELFNKLVLLDKGGKLAYFGSPFKALEYFRKYSDKPKISENENVIIDPDFLLDTIEQQISDIDGTALPVRKFSPDFWQIEFVNHLKDIPKKEKRKPADSIILSQRKTIYDHLSVSKTLLQRNFVNKLRDKSNLIITFLLPPFLGLFVGAILHYTPGNEYTFFENKHIGTFLFLSMLIAIFLGITNSVEEIIKDQNVLNREKMLKISSLSYLNSKILTLIPFAFIQNLLFVYVGYFILEGKEFYLVFTLILTVISFCGISVGLFISSIPNLSSKAAINIIPVILIPQIVFGGALIQYQEMNKQLVFNANSPIPEVCQMMPSRWGFESLVTYLGYNNSYRVEQRMEDELEIINNKIKNATMDNDIQLLLEERNALRAKMDTIKMLYHDTHGNLDISQAIKIDGNLEYKNFMAGKTSVYPMFIGHKTLPVINKKVSTAVYNSIVIIFMSLVINLVTLMILKVRFK